MEWLALLLLIPLIVIPLVVLFGFAGCSFEPGVAPNLPQAPVLVSAVPGDETSITLEWTNPEMAPVAFQIDSAKVQVQKKQGDAHQKSIAPVLRWTRIVS